MSGLRKHPFLILLVSIGVLIVVYPFLHPTVGSRLLYDLLLTLVFAASFSAVFDRNRLLALLLAIPTLIGAWIAHALPAIASPALSIFFYSCAFLFLGMTMAAILRTVVNGSGVTGERLSGALCGYLLIGLAFGHLYALIETIIPGSFRADEAILVQLRSDDFRQFVLTYFSFITLTTVGYGEITPGIGAARGLAMAEAIIGQFYVAVLVGGLVGIKVSESLSVRQRGQAERINTRASYPAGR